MEQSADLSAERRAEFFPPAKVSPPFTTEAAIVTILWEGHNYGLGIMNTVSERTGVEICQGSLYRTLKKLESEGYVLSFPRPDKTDRGKPRQYYMLSDKGKILAERHLKAMRQLSL